MPKRGLELSKTQINAYCEHHGFKNPLDRPDSSVSNPKPKRNQEESLGEAIQRETKGMGRIRVRFVLCRVRLLDPDGASASIKDLLDGARRSSLIPDDSWYHISLEVLQEKVAHFAQENTKIRITYP